MINLFLLLIDCSVTWIFDKVFLPGSSYIASIKVSSNIDFKPLAPIPLSIANFDIFSRALLSNSNLRLSMENNVLYCSISEFFGFVNMSYKWFSFNSWSWVITGNLPINSGINPYSSRSSVVAYCSVSWLFEFFSSDWKPIE